MIKAIFFDVDGTLVPMNGKKIVDSALNAINILQNKGIKCVVCSGRDFREIGKNNNVLEKVKFDATIASTGQYCLDKDGVPFYIQYMNENQRREIVNLFKEKKYAICLKTEFGSYINCLTSINESIYKKFNRNLWPIKEYQGEKIFQAMVYINNEDRKELIKSIKDLTITSWHPLMADVIPLNGGKSKGIEKYLEKENIKIEETMAFGDSENDIDMLIYAGIGVAMGNANEKVKKSANYITDDCDKDGIYKALKHFDVI